jgi:hypothetical protein
MPAKQAVVAAAAATSPSDRASARPTSGPGSPTARRNIADHGRNFARAPGLRDGNQSADGDLQHSSALTIVGSKQSSVCLHASQRACLRVQSPAGKKTLLDDGVL